MLFGQIRLILGGSATRNDLTRLQENRFVEHLYACVPDEFHHGDCVGGDARMHALVRLHAPACRIVLHPPADDRLRAFCVGDEVREPCTYLKRNRNVVAALVNDWDRLIALPPTDEHMDNGGTWYTVDHCIKQLKKCYVFGPSGRPWFRQRPSSLH